MISLLMLNSATIALACGTYHGFCGNGAGAPQAPNATRTATSGWNASDCQDGKLSPGLHWDASAKGTTAKLSAVEAIRGAACNIWLPPIPTDRCATLGFTLGVPGGVTRTDLSLSPFPLGDLLYLWTTMWLPR